MITGLEPAIAGANIIYPAPELLAAGRLGELQRFRTWANEIARCAATDHAPF
jgi:hypothetical protein